MRTWLRSRFGRVTLVGVLALAVVSVWLYGGWGADQGSFAVWPEDDRRDARRECLQHLLDQSWRRSSEGVKERFVLDVLGFEGVDDLSRGPTYVSTERFGPCWYVTHVSVEDGYAHIDVGTRWEGDSLVAVVDWKGHSEADVELGFGGETQRARVNGTSPAEFRFEGVDGPGHYVIRFLPDDPDTSAYADTVPMPPRDPATEEVVRATESQVCPLPRNRGCGRRYSLGTRWVGSERKGLFGILRELRIYQKDLDAPPRFRRQGDDWIADVGGSSLRIDTDRVGDCYRVIAVEPASGEDLDLHLTKGRRQIGVSFDWLGADRARLQALDSFYYLRKTELPLAFPAGYENLRTPDYVLLTLHRNDLFYTAIGYEVTTE